MLKALTEKKEEISEEDDQNGACIEM